MTGTVIDFLAIILIGLPAACWLQVVLLWVVNGAGPSPVLRYGLQSAILRATASSIVGGLSVARLIGVRLPPDIAVLALAISLIALSLPSLLWLWRFYTGGFDADED